MAFSPDFQLAVTGSDDHKVRIYNARTTDLICDLSGHTGIPFVGKI